LLDNTPKLTIRGLNSDDWSDIYTLLTFPSLLVNTFELPYASEEAFRERVNHSQPQTHILIAETTLPSGRKRLIGAAMLAVQTYMRRRHTGDLTLLVHPDFQGTDVAQGILAAVCDMADQWMGLRRIQAIVFVEDQVAIDLFLAAGFEREAVLRKYARRAGQLSDGLLLARLAPAQSGVQRP